jgi:cathepsin F
VALFAVAAIADDAALRMQFIEFQQTYGKMYANADEYELRYAVFKANVAAAAKKQLTDSHAQWGITKFSDMTTEEFKNIVLMKNKIHHTPRQLAKPLPQIPLQASFDWRNHNPPVVTPVYNQGQCGSCWAFSITENIESQWALAGNTLTSLSMQQVVDCDTSDDGCNGGDPPTAYEYVISAGGMDPYSDYPYTAEDGSCTFNSGEVVAKISSYNTIGSETQAQQYLVQNGPLSVCVDASTWSSYNGGIIMKGSGCGTSLDHCVMITGYGSESGTPFWWVRNSWGTDWGQNGYLQVEMGQDVCGIAQEITSSVV